MSDAVNILLAAGSPDSIKIIEHFKSRGSKVIVVNTSRQIFDSLMKMKGIRIVTSDVSFNDFERRIENLKINFIIDETNYYSAIVSPVLMEAARKHKIVYCRYEGKNFDVKSEKAIYARDILHCVDILNRRNGRVFLATDATELEEYTKVTEYDRRLFVKVSPSVKAIETCVRLKIPSANIFAMEGVVSKDLFVELIKYSGASVLVSGDSSADRVDDVMIEAAEYCGIPIVMVNKPGITYINKFRNIEDISSFIENAAKAFGNQGAH